MRGRLIYTHLIFIFAIVANAQNVSYKVGDDAQNVTIQDDTSTIKAVVLLKDIDIKHKLDRTYFSYARDRYIGTIGSHVGKLLHGSFQRFDVKYQLTEEGVFNMGLRDGLWMSWVGGELHKTCEYRKGLLHGKCDTYNSVGDMILSESYREGKLQGKTKKFEDNKVVETIKYKSGLPIESGKSLKTNSDTVGITEKVLADRPRSKSQSHSAQQNTPMPPPTANPLNEESGRPKTRKRNAEDQKNASTSRDVVALKPDTELIPSVLNIYVRDASNKSALAGLPIKVSQTSGKEGGEEFLFFGYTDKNGLYELSRNSKGDYFLFIAQTGYEPQRVRIYDNTQNRDLNIDLKPKISCGVLAGEVQPASKNIAVVGAVVFIKDTKGRLIETTYTDNKGIFSICLPCNTRYEVHVQGDGFLNHKEFIFLSEDCSTERNELAVFLPSNNPPFPQPNSIELPIESDVQFVKNTPPTTTHSRQPTSTVSKISQSSSGSNNFHVIAGTFSSRANAEKRLSEVQQAGFRDAMVVQISDSGYFAVSLGILGSRETASALRKQFENSTKIAAYVRDTPL